MRDSVTRRLYIRLTAVCPVPCAMYHVCFVFVTSAESPVVVLTPFSPRLLVRGDTLATRPSHARLLRTATCQPAQSTRCRPCIKLPTLHHVVFARVLHH